MNGWRTVLVLLAVGIGAAIVVWQRSRGGRSEGSQGRASAPRTPDATGDWRSVMTAAGKADRIPELEKLVRPAVRLEARRIGSAPAVVGESRLGGTPDLPEAFAWPRYKGKPLAFIAQVNLHDVVRLLPESALPKEGHLWFFYVADQSTWGFDPKDAGSALVHHEVAAKLVPRPLPAEMPQEGRFEPCTLGLSRYDDVPDLSDERNPLHDANDRVSEDYTDVRSHLAGPEGPSHKLLGHPQPIQNPMEDECALATGGIYVGDAKGYEDPRAPALLEGKYDWRLLLQIDSDDAARMMWGDVGMLYFWIREQDLRDWRFEKAWLILQCS